MKEAFVGNDLRKGIKIIIYEIKIDIYLEKKWSGPCVFGSLEPEPLAVKNKSWSRLNNK